MTCCLTCSSRLLRWLGRAAGRDLGQRVVAAAAAGAAGPAARRPASSAARRCGALALQARHDVAQDLALFGQRRLVRAVADQLLERLVGALGELERARLRRGRPARAPRAAARLRPSAAATAPAAPARCRGRRNRPPCRLSPLPNRRLRKPCFGSSGTPASSMQSRCSSGDHPVLGVALDQRAALERRAHEGLGVEREHAAQLAVDAGLELLDRHVRLGGRAVRHEMQLHRAVARLQQLHQAVRVAQRLQGQFGHDHQLVEAREQRRLAHHEMPGQVEHRHVEVVAHGVGEHQHLVVGHPHRVVEGLLGGEHVQALAELRHRVLQEHLVDPLGVVERLAQAAGRLDVERSAMLPV